MADPWTRCELQMTFSSKSSGSGVALRKSIDSPSRKARFTCRAVGKIG